MKFVQTEERGNKFWNYVEPSAEGGHILIVKSENDIISEYSEYWYTRMVKKYGEEYVNNTFCVNDMIYDWAVMHGAWEA